MTGLSVPLDDRTPEELLRSKLSETATPIDKLSAFQEYAVDQFELLGDTYDSPQEPNSVLSDESRSRGQDSLDRVKARRNRVQ